jgi:hypothetical protein
VVVGKIEARQNPPYFVIREFFDMNARIVVYAPPPRELRLGQTVDVEGTLSTLPTGDRALVSVVVLGHLDAQGNLLYHGPLLKGPFKPIPWKWKRPLAVGATTSVVGPLSASSPGEPNSLLEGGAIYCPTIADAKAQPDDTAVGLQCKRVASTGSGLFVMGEDVGSDTLAAYCTTPANATDRINCITGTMQTAGGQRVLDVDGGPGFDQQGYVGGAETAAEGTIAWAKTFPDGTTLPAALNDKLVSRAFGGQGYYYVQEPTREAGIRVNDEPSALSLEPGDVVSILSGEITTVDGERAIKFPVSSLGTPVDPPKPLGINNRAVGGGQFNVYTPGPVGGSGLNNVGLLIRAYGKVTSIGDGYFYVDDGSTNVSDGTGATGVRVVGLSGCQPYVPNVNDYVAVTGGSGLATYEPTYGLARTIRLAGSSDLDALRPTGPPPGLQVHATGSTRITCYWDSVPGATGYNIYRGTSSEGEDYLHPLNGGAPWNTPSYPGSSVFAYTDENLPQVREYFYTVKAVRHYGESGPSVEDSDIPDAGAIPWDRRDAYAITSAVQSLSGHGNADLVRVIGPDNTTYCSWYGVILPEGALLPGTNLVQYTNGAVLPLPDDGGELGEGGGAPTGGLSLLTTTGNPTDGPYRRVRSKDTFTGVRGSFHPGDRNTISLSLWYSKDTYWTYLGSRWEKLSPIGKVVAEVDIDAGLQWSRRYSLFNPHLSVKYWRFDTFGRAFFMPWESPLRFQDSVYWPIGMEYQLHHVGGTTDYIPTLAVGGIDQNWEISEVVLSAVSPVKFSTAMMKRVHSIAQGKPPNMWRQTGSRFWAASFLGGELRNASGNWETWTGDSEHTVEDAAFPWNVTPRRVKWTVPAGKEYYEEHDIECDLR